MIDPFKISDQTCISFSGGRTSAYMLWRVLQSNGGLPSNAKVLFANTGKECEETLDFVNDCSTYWGVPITWIEYQYAEETGQRFKVVDYLSASRDGEPFAEMINQNGKPFLPNPVMRICTARLKIKPFIAYLRSLGWTDWDNMVGIRADEQRRAAKIRANPGEDGGASKNVERVLPLVDANVTKEMVGQFWREQPFDLKLPNHNGVTMHGNCDLCFLKSASQIQSLIIEKPERAIWWAKMEEGVASATGYGPNSVFRKDRPNYSQMLKFSQDQRNMFDPNEQGIDCFCGD
jgi:3'-phosphoadenosine 5'-phosphosulfate sulfotransferase (PAPS reductase)/FAD synthetase